MITTGIKCNRCLEELVLEEIFDGDYEIGSTYNFVCPNCGARFECTEVTDDEKQDYEFYENGEEDISGRLDEEDIMNGHCINCGHKVSMCNNFMLSDYDDTITDDDDDKMNFVLNQCPYCGMQEVRWDTAENEKKHYPYWKEDLEEDGSIN